MNSFKNSKIVPFIESKGLATNRNKRVKKDCAIMRWHYNSEEKELKVIVIAKARRLIRKNGVYNSASFELGFKLR